MKKLLAMLLAAVMLLSVIGAVAEETAEQGTPLVVATSTLSEKFSPYFADTAYDQDVVNMTQASMMTTDRTGGIIYNGIEGETHSYNGTDYTYYGTGDLSVDYDEEADITTYTYKMRDDLKFSDGEPMTIDDVIFNYYVFLDPAYNGSTTLNSYDIVGLQAYRTQIPEASVEETSATAAAVVTQKLGGSLEQTTTYTFLSNLLTVLLVPLCFPMIEKAAHISFLQAFVQIFREVLLVLVVPMLLAYVVKHHMHRLHRRIIAIRDLSYYMWGCSLMIVTGTTVKNIVHAQTTATLLLAIALLGLLLCVGQFAVGRFIGHFFGRTQEAGQALGQKNTAFAIWMAYTYLNPLSSVGPGCYILWQNIINSIEIWQKRKEEGEALKDKE